MLDGHSFSLEKIKLLVANSDSFNNTSIQNGTIIGKKKKTNAMKNSLNQLIVFFILSFFATNESFSQVTYADIEPEEFKQNIGIHKRNTIIRFGFAHMPTRFSEASIVSDIPFVPFIEADLPSVTVSNGIHVGIHHLLTENWYAGFDFSYLFSSRQESRRRDNIGYIGVTGGYQLNLQNWNKNHLLSVEAGIGAQFIDRPITGVGGYKVSLTRMNYVFSPGMRYEINVFKEKLYLFTQAKYFHQLTRSGSRSGLEFERRREDFIDLFPLNDPAIIASPGTRLEIGNAIEFSVGIRINL